MDLKNDVVSMQQYLKHTVYKNQIPPFKAELTETGKAQGWTLDDLQKRFSNQIWDNIV